MTFQMTSSVFICLLVCVVVSMVGQTSAHQVRLGFNFKNSIPLGCLARPNMTITPPPTPAPATDNEVTCVRELTAVFKQQLNTLVGMHLAVWRSLHAECSPNAPFALFMYLFTKDMVKKLELSYFTCAQDIAYLLLLESQGYFDALVLDAAQNTTLPALPWQDAFNYGKTGRSTVGEDFNIQSNVFFSNELTRALLIACLTTKPYLFKADYDKIDQVIQNILPGTNAALAALYDANYKAADTQMATIAAWRAIAWADTTAMRPVLEPAQSRNTAETLQRSLSLKSAITGALTEADRLEACMKNPNPTDDYLASFFL